MPSILPARCAALLFVLSTIPTACAPTTETVAATGTVATDRAADPTRPSAVYCRLAEPIAWSQADTDETIRAIKAHNAVVAALCPPG
ncbi:hypothetical protein ABB55_21800 [Prosthecomicrobium hirschii]|uniref:Uncharacterized protein n=1 Tax=Prosthecodimorpha hirschii TaxID=665126 RepID=A0A0P6VNV8_9HYPH|nr:hypothetical protein [Prosthecomicrobium hirschii]KPL54531.1 hypothetical protein ABB55_21800 [Prosthecomicrobium hirschii]